MDYGDMGSEKVEDIVYPAALISPFCASFPSALSF